MRTRFGNWIGAAGVLARFDVVCSQRHTCHFPCVQGQLSNLRRKSVEPIALDRRSVRTLQGFSVSTSGTTTYADRLPGDRARRKHQGRQR
jgi:hypothetical protein